MPHQSPTTLKTTLIMFSSDREHNCHFFLVFFCCKFFVNKRYVCEINRSRSHVIDYTYVMDGFLFWSEFLDRINEIK